MPQISVILPCYNPPMHWEKRVTNSIELLQQNAESIELIIVNDGSSADLSLSFVTIKNKIKNSIIISYNQNRGKGYAIREGIAAATGDYIVYTDIDLPYTNNSVQKIIDSLVNDKYDIAIGVKDQNYYRGVPLFRTGISKILRGLSTLLLGLKNTDTQCGLKGMTKQASSVWAEGVIDHYLFDLEAIYKAEKKGYKIIGVPVTLREGVKFSTIKGKVIVTELRNFIRLTIKQKRDHK
ncbi:MAG: glycosyltransferase [Taibaiella sp.]|nr:glycosyltransferase [Taibaiella sp.]